MVLRCRAIDLRIGTGFDVILIGSLNIAKDTVHFCYLVLLRLSVGVFSNDEAIPLNFKVYFLVFRKARDGAPSSIAMIGHAIALESDVDLGALLSASHTVLPSDGASGLLRATVRTFDLFWVRRV